MEIYPAIDLRGGRCVRLRQGRFDQETVFDSDPAAIALRFQDAGARWLHVVDLDGARHGRPQNLEAVGRIIASVGMQVEVGGGIRSDETAAEVLGLGAARVIVGTRAVRDPEWLKEVAGRFPGRVALGLDARDGRVAVEGWEEESARTAEEFARSVSAVLLAAIVYTDIVRDGMMTGPNVEATGRLARAAAVPVIASGGVTTVDDIRRLKAEGVIAGAIIGRALYEGTITIEAALAAAGE